MLAPEAQGAPPFRSPLLLRGEGNGQCWPTEPARVWGVGPGSLSGPSDLEQLRKEISGSWGSR